LVVRTSRRFYQSLGRLFVAADARLEAKPTAISYQLILVLDTFLCLDSFFVGVFYLAHFGYGVG
jgi:hypothetical protein